jgi:Rad3-related DNA helicase/DNA polymerase III epsilon subunit-like protein
VALDLETTGLHPEQDVILEIAAIKFQGDEILETFETFVASNRPIPYRVQRLTGIKLEHLTGAPALPSLLPRLQAFLGDLPIVGHSIPFDASFLRRWNLARTNPLVDTFELATVLLPSLSSYNLGQVAEALGIEVPQDRHRAMVDTVLAMRVFQALHERLQGVDISLLKDLANLDAPRSWPLLHFFRQELRERQQQDGIQGSLERGSLGDRFAAQLGMDPRILSFAIAKQAEAPQANSPTQPTKNSSPEITAQTGAQLIAEHAGNAPLHGYTEAYSTIQEALTRQQSLLLEMTVGGNGHVPALLPALQWIAAQAERRLVIACSGQQNARRLIDKILPELQQQLNTNLPVAYFAEHGGYLCVHRWFGAALRRTSGELSAEQARGLAKLGLWAQQTLNGERSELTLLPQEAAAWKRISSGIERLPSADQRAGTSYQHCMYKKNGYCFIHRAEERVKTARIVVTTHSGLFDDLTNKHSLLSDIPGRLVLDADLLEEEYARWSSAELDQNQLTTLISTIGSELADGRYQGLLALAAPSLRANGPGGLSRTHTIPKAELDSRMLNWLQTLRQTNQAIEKLFAGFTQLMEEAAQEGRDKVQARHQRGKSAERLDQPLRLTGQMRHLCSWENVELAWKQVEQRLQQVIDLLHNAEKIIQTSGRNRNQLDPGSGEDRSLAVELAAVAQELQKQRELGKQALSLSDEEHVFWLRVPPLLQLPASGTHRHVEPPPDNPPVLHAQQIQLSALLQRLLLKEKQSAIFVGSALTVDDAFGFTQERFGLDNDTNRAVSVVTERPAQTLVYTPEDVPEPNAPQFQRTLDESLIQLASTLDGRLVGLYTSHASLRSSYTTIKPLLEARGILVLAQGVDGSPRQLWQTFQKQDRVVLLGTGGFWDNIEEIGASPTCLVVTRLPMPVLNDPAIAARAEHYSDQLNNLTVPIAAQRLRRVLNRLLWNDARRNALVIFDRRVVSKAYGTTIMNSLPRSSRRQGAASHMPETILDWLTAEGAWE